VKYGMGGEEVFLCEVEHRMGGGSVPMSSGAWDGGKGSVPV